MEFDWNALGTAVGSGLWASLIVIGMLGILRLVAVRFVRGNSEILHTHQRRWINTIKNGTLIFGLLLLVLIWAPQLQTFALSLTAIAVAIVISFKEMILCITGGFYRAVTKPFVVGDWIICGDIGGEVVSVDPISVKIEQIDRGEEHSYRFTGRTAHIPNSLFFTTNILNANFLKNYRYEKFSINMPSTTALRVSQMEGICLDAFNPLYEPYKADAQAYLRKVKRVSGVDFPATGPDIQTTTSDLGHFDIEISAFVPTAKLAEIRPEYMRRALDDLYQQQAALTPNDDTAQG